MTTNPGVLPKDGYKQVDLKKITLKYVKLLDEREDHFGRPLIRRLRRNGLEEKATEMEKNIIDNSIYRRMKNEIGRQMDATTDG